MPVSLPSSGVSINPGGASSQPSTLDLPAQGVSLKVGVSITGGGGSDPHPGDNLLLSGDMQSGADILLLSGDAQGGTDALLLSGTP